MIIERRPIETNVGLLISRHSGQPEIDTQPTQERLPLQVVTELAFLTSMLNVFRKDAYAAHPEIKKKITPELHKEDRRKRKTTITDHMTGLLRAYVARQADAPFPEGKYGMRLGHLQKELDAAKVKIDAASSQWTPAQQHRHILNAKRNFKRFADDISLKEQTGLTDIMIKDAKKARFKEYAASLLWFAMTEVPQFATGWAAGIVEKHVLDIKNLAFLLTAAVLSRATTTGLLVWKGYLSQKLTDKTGYAPDPATKFTQDRWDNAGLGFAALHGPAELGYLINTIIAGVTLGVPAASVVETAANVVSLPRQIVEIAGMKKAVKKTLHADNSPKTEEVPVFDASAHPEWIISPNPIMVKPDEGITL